MPRPIILCVDDEKTVLNSLRQELEYGLENQFLLELAESAEEGLEVLRDLMQSGYEVQVVISDQLMPGMKGDQFLIQVHRLNPNIRKILLSGQANTTSISKAEQEADLYRYIPKPWDDLELRQTVQQAAQSFIRSGE